MKEVDSVPRRITKYQVEVTTSKKGKGTKNFTGCWTCRKRGVKCDELRPSCNNCKVHHVQCEGYSVKLCWEGRTANSSKRRLEKNRCLILYEWKENQLLDGLQIDYYLDRIDAASGFISSKNVESPSEFGYGPFTVFSSYSELRISSQDSLIKVQDTEAGFQPTQTHPQSFTLRPIAKIREILENMSFTGLYEDLQIEVFLLDFWDGYLSNIMTPVDATEANPYKLLLKEALDKCQYSEVQRALIHCVCAMCSSFLSTTEELNLIIPEYKDANFPWYWKFHKLKALSYVSASYTWKEISSIEELSILVGSLYFLVASDIFNNSDEWQIHLKGAVSTLKTIFDSDQGTLVSGAEDSSSTSSTLIYFAQMTKLTYLFSTLYLFSDDVCNKYLTIIDLDFINFPQEDEDLSLLYRTEGVTSSMVKCLSNIVKYFQVEQSPEDKAETVKNIEQELVNCEPPSFLNNMNTLNPLIIYHQSMIFYTAIKLLFLREVKMLDPHDLQDVVDSGIDHLEINEEISRHINGMGLFWPCFVICCEATSFDTQRRAIQWLESVEPYCVTSIKRGTNVIKTVWERRKNGDKLSWLTVIREVDPALMLA